MTTSRPVKSILPIALIAMAIAAVLPFDRGLQAISGGHVVAHVLLMGLLTLAGGWLARRAGLALGGDWPVGMCVALGGAAYVVLLDAVVFRFMLKDSMVALVHMPLAGRLGVFMARAFNENVIYRLFGFSAAMAGLRRLYRGGEVPLGPVLLAGLLMQLANIALNVWLPASHGPTLAELGYGMLRYVAPGVVWAWLYWRYGFVTTEIASVGGHLFLQPVYGLLI